MATPDETGVPVGPTPTPVTSGISPVTAGDLAYAVQQAQGLPRQALMALADGSLRGDACRVCVVLEGWDQPRGSAARNLHEWHGSDAIRCGVIYGVARALVEAHRA